MWIYVHPFCQIIWSENVCPLVMEIFLERFHLFPFSRTSSVWMLDLFDQFSNMPIISLWLSTLNFFVPILRIFFVFIFWPIFISVISTVQDFLLYSKYYFITFCFMDAIASLIFLILLIGFLKFSSPYRVSKLFLLLLSVYGSNFHVRCFSQISGVIEKWKQMI